MINHNYYFSWNCLMLWRFCWSCIWWKIWTGCCFIRVQWHIRSTILMVWHPSWNPFRLGGRRCHRSIVAAWWAWNISPLIRSNCTCDQTMQLGLQITMHTSNSLVVGKILFPEVWCTASWLHSYILKCIIIIKIKLYN